MISTFIAISINSIRMKKQLKMALNINVKANSDNYRQLNLMQQVTSILKASTVSMMWELLQKKQKPSTSMTFSVAFHWTHFTFHRTSEQTWCLSCLWFSFLALDNHTLLFGLLSDLPTLDFLDCTYLQASVNLQYTCTCLGICQATLLSQGCTRELWGALGISGTVAYYNILLYNNYIIIYYYRITRYFIFIRLKYIIKNKI